MANPGDDAPGDGFGHAQPGEQHHEIERDVDQAEDELMGQGAALLGIGREGAASLA